MKIRLFVVLLVILGFAGCGNSSTAGSNLPALGGAVAIATIGGDQQVVTYNESIDIVCIENTTTTATPARGNMSAFSCWETSSAPKKLQEVVSRYLNGKK